MESVSVFDDLPDLALIELFTYLSSFDALWAFSRINYRLTILLAERGFLRRLNLSPARFGQFNILFGLLTLKDIQSLAIDCEGSPLQLIRWPRLPQLRTLRIKGVCNVDDLKIFLLVHAATLTHLILESNQDDIMFGFSRDTLHAEIDWTDLIGIIFRFLFDLRSLDMGTDCRCCIVRSWSLTKVIAPLQYLRISLDNINDVVLIMLTEPFSKTLRQFHVTMRSDQCKSDSLIYSLPSMINLHTFTLAQDYLAKHHISSLTIEKLISSRVMPVLRRMRIAILTTIDELDRIGQLLRFNDGRQVNVDFVLCIPYWRKYMKLTDSIPRGSHFYPKEIVGATYVTTEERGGDIYFFRNDPFRFGGKTFRHMWYTLPWTFKDFFRSSQSEECLTQVKVFTPSPMMINDFDRCRPTLLETSDTVLPPPIMSLPHVMTLNDVDTLYLSNCRRSMNIYFPRLRHLVLYSLNRFCPLPPTLRSIQIVLNCRGTGFVPFDWPVLRTLATLPSLNSLRVIVCEITRELDESTSQLLANTAIKLADFRFCFRKRFGLTPEDFNWFDRHELFIKKLSRHIIHLSGNSNLSIVIEEGGCGLFVWL